MDKSFLFTGALIVSAILTGIYFGIPEQQTTLERKEDGMLFVKNFPNSDKLMLKWWKENESRLQKESDLIPARGFFSLSVMDFGNGYETLPAEDFIAGISQDDYICFTEIKSEKKCLKKKTLMSIMGDMTKKRVIYIGEKEYTQLPDGTITPSN